MPRGDGEGLDTLTVLRAHDGKRLTKRFTLAGNGAVIGQGYDDRAKWFSAEREHVGGIHDLHRLLCRLERDPQACVIRGEAAPGIAMARTRRRKVENGGAFAEVPRRWVMLDIDEGVPLPPGCKVLEEPETAARVLLDVLAAHAPELEDVTAVVQFSASAGLDELAAEDAAEASGTRRDWSGVAKRGLRAHVWYWLREPLTETELKPWRERVEGAGLKLDAATFRTVQPHYCAAPVFDAPLRDPLAGRRTVLMQGAEDAALLRVPDEAERAAWREASQAVRCSGIGIASHAGHGYAALLDEIGGVDGFHQAVLRAAGSFIATNWPDPDLDALKAELRARILAADPGGRTPADIEDRASDRHLDGIIAWVMQQEEAKRAAEADAPPPTPVAPTFPDKGVPLDVAQARMDEALAVHVARLRGGIAMDQLLSDGRPPALLLGVTVGGGKSEAAIRAAQELLDAARERGEPGGALFYLAPRHDLNEELRRRIAAAHPELCVEIWRGMEQEDPGRPGSAMCLDLELPRAAAEAGLPRTTPCIACPRRRECGYGTQGLLWGADVVLAAHQLAFGQKPSMLPDAAMLVVDESFYSAAVKGLESSHRVQMPLSELRDHRTGAVTGVDRERLLFLRRLAYRVLEGHGEGGLLREAFVSAGMSAQMAEEWLDLEWRVKPDVSLDINGMSRGAILDRLRDAKSAGFNKLRPALARDVRGLLKGEAARSVKVEVAPGGAALRFAWREEFAAWAEEVPTLFLDGTTHPDLVRIWAPYLEVVEVEVEAPHQRVRQVPREFGRSFFTGNPANVRRLADLVVVELARTDGGVLVVAQQAVVELLREALSPRFASAELPERLHLAHHGAVTGLNRWEEVERALIVGRPAVNRRHGERLAEVLRGGPVEVTADREDDHWPRVTAGIRMADGSGHPVQQPRHPDALVEAVRSTISEGAVLQAIGRARGVRRGPDRPVLVTVLGNLALPVTVHEVADWEAVQPDRLEVAAAEAALNGRALPLAAADLQAARPDLWSTAKAAARDLERREEDILPAKTTPKPLIGSSYKGFGGSFPLLSARYRKPGARGPWPSALVPQENGRAALEALVGPLAGYEVEKAPPPPMPILLRNLRVIPFPPPRIIHFNEAPEQAPDPVRELAASTGPEHAAPFGPAFDVHAGGWRVLVLAFSSRKKWLPQQSP